MSVAKPSSPAHSPRRTLVLAGDASWARQAAAGMLWPDTLWIGDQAPAGVRVLPTDRAREALGEDLTMLVIDAHAGLDPDALGAVSGALRGGGVLLLLTPLLDQWTVFDDPDKVRYASHPHGASAVGGRFLARLTQVLRSAPGVQEVVQDARIELPLPTPDVLRPSGDDPDCLTADQAAAVAAILRVARGHRRRPLVLTADRGRGKSAALGIAAARLLADGMRHIVVTAPRPAAVAALFAQAERLLPAAEQHGNRLESAGGSLVFVAPDALLHHPPETDLVLVDEAAAIPVPLLSRLLTNHARIVFAGTVHGYEGSGRGFAVRFRAELDARSPQWRSLRLETPIRYGLDDPLENWVNRALLLDAEPAPTESLADIAPALLQTAVIDQEALAADEALLRQVFGLLVQAHYQTRPTDLRQLLDAPGLAIWLAHSDDLVVGVCLVQVEGDLDESLAVEITAGRRRPHGHLIPQALAQQFGLATLARQRTARIMRIAVHPALQRHGIGSRLLAAVAERAQADDCDWWGASFAADPASLAFWQGAGCGALRLGLSRDAASGTYSAILLAPLSAMAQGCYGALRQRFAETLIHGLAGNWRELEPAVASALLHSERSPALLTDWDRAELGAFAAGRRELAASQLALWRLACDRLASARSLPEGYELLVRRVLQRWSDAEVVAEAGLAGRRELQDRMRGVVAGLLSETLS